MKKTNITFIVLLALATIIAGSGYFLFPSLATEDGDFRGTLVIAILSTVLLLGAAFYFLSSLKSFKVGLKVAYYLLVTGIVLYSIVLAQFFLTLLVDLSDQVVLRNALFLVPYGLTSFFAYLGMRKFAALLEVKNIWTSFLFVLVTASVAAGLAILLPRPMELVEVVGEPLLMSIMAVLVWCTVFGIAAAVVAMHVRTAISTTYKSAMSWTIVALVVLALTAIHELVVKIYFFGSEYAGSDYASAIFILTGILFLRASLAFKETQQHTLQLAADASHVDVVIATASLISKPHAVDKELDRLRSITARTPDASALNDTDKKTLRDVYLYLEDYLVNREPLSKFTREELRDNLPEAFAAKLK